MLSTEDRGSPSTVGDDGATTSGLPSPLSHGELLALLRRVGPITRRDLLGVSRLSRSTLVERIDTPVALAALHVMTTLSGSVLIALAHAVGPLDADQAWAAAHVDELYQESVWGEDYEAMERRKRREADFRADMIFVLSC